MKDLPDSSEASVPFRNAEAWLHAVKDKQIETILTSVADIVLLLSAEGRIRDVGGAPENVRSLEASLGELWIDTVTIESRPKIEELLAKPGMGRWRQVTQSATGDQYPVRYLVFPAGTQGQMVAVGRDDRAGTLLQQRLIQVQQSLERDYLALRQAESRYRLLFDVTAEPMVIVDGTTRRVREMNPAARTLFAISGDPIGQPLSGYFAQAERDGVTAFLGAAAAGASASPLDVGLHGGAVVALSARAFRQGGATFLLLRFSGDAVAANGADMADVIERMPDAFVLTDTKMAIVSANSAFVELVQAASPDQLRGKPLGDFLGRPGIDLELMTVQLRDQAVVRNIPTILRGLNDGREEVEVSAVHASARGGYHGFSMRVVARRMRDLPPTTQSMPRSVEQLTELIGRMPLKDIVRESTDLIERQCIEAALSFTSNNRASAAEILGLSRQSLYSKLHRHGIGGSEAVED